MNLVRWVVIFERGNERLVPSKVDGQFALRPLLENEYTRDAMTFDTRKHAVNWVNALKQDVEAAKLFTIFTVSIKTSSELVLLKP